MNDLLVPNVVFEAMEFKICHVFKSAHLRALHSPKGVSFWGRARVAHCCSLGFALVASQSSIHRPERSVQAERGPESKRAARSTLVIPMTGGSRFVHQGHEGFSAA